MVENAKIYEDSKGIYWDLFFFFFNVYKLIQDSFFANEFFKEEKIGLEVV
jgi:hypothetical protein